MENKINLAELLKDCPKGMELDCTIFEGLEFDGIADNEYLPICCRIKNPKGGYTVYNFTKYGCWIDADFAKCVIFPKGKTTWEGFQRPIKDGDIVTYKYENGLVSMILKKFVNFVEIHHHCALYDNAKGFVTNNYIVGEPRYTHLATEEEKQKLFDAIKANGYEWNAETKTLEKLIVPKFKVGDRIEFKYHERSPELVVKIKDNGYILSSGITLMFQDEDAWDLYTGKFDITTLKPFDKVLVRDRNNDEWRGQFFSHYNNCSDRPYICIGVEGMCKYKQCIPFKSNEHLLGTTDDCDEYFKTW